MSAISTKQIWWLVIAVAVIWFGNLEYRKLIKPDEGRYAEIPREMVASGDWVTPRLNGLKYFEKPPLQYWATATAYTVFGEHQWTSRLWAALTGFTGLFIVWFAGLRLFGREAAGYAAALLGSTFLYVGMGHINTLDMGVTFFITLGILSLLLAQAQTDIRKQRNWMMLAWAGMGLAVLSKGLMGLVLPGASLFVYMAVQRDFSLLRRMHWLPGLAVFLLVTAPWFYLVMKANPEFFDKFFIYEHYTRFTTTEHGRYQPWYYFIPILLGGMLPWSVLMLDTLWRSVPGMQSGKANMPIGREFNAERFLLVWIVFVYVFFSASGSKLPSYLLPMFPALALLMGKQVAAMSARRLLWLVAPMLPLMLLALGLAPFTDRLAETPVRAQMYGEYAHWLIAAFLLWSLGVAAALILLRRPNSANDRKPVAIAVLALSSLLAVQIGTSGYNAIAKERSGYPIADAIRPYVKEGMPFYSVLTYEQTLPFYLKRTFTLVQYQDEMGFGIMQEPHLAVPDIASFAKVWQAQPEALAIMPLDVYPLLKQQDMAMKIIYEDTQHIVVSKP
ncbi:MAG: phospholipid carrier-dependent glycosyltransferase [Gallionellales bacterium RIFCSPLOWO2_02_FULL_57_47]|nr:MAG: phospholipid carrier-dependent glycosyltransferase [Gallionellales bacterium RIFCSPLOWO2_02_FULL_57_47]OGT18060.1 MAG: phospholipid carrier-dependent glycosyltransferase [Gallionellales bacterium RIFCSPHIGHO2_02_FULL_57_16]